MSSVSLSQTKNGTKPGSRGVLKNSGRLGLVSRSRHHHVSVRSCH
jgi:hypothetical protein